MKTFVLVLIVTVSFLDLSSQEPKPGFCPPPKPCKASGNSASCQDDGNCLGNKKCCTVGCKTECVKPRDIAPILPPASTGPGVCPSKPGKNCDRKEISVECLEDKHCFAGEKCCEVLCDTKCVKPVRDVPGVEVTPPPPPPPPSEKRSGFCPFDPGCKGERTMVTCTQDDFCPPGRKCCKVKCTTKCMKPLETEPIGQTKPEPATEGFTIPMTRLVVGITGGDDVTEEDGNSQQGSVGDRTTEPSPTTVKKTRRPKKPKTTPVVTEEEITTEEITEVDTTPSPPVTTPPPPVTTPTLTTKKRGRGRGRNKTKTTEQPKTNTEPITTPVPSVGPRPEFETPVLPSVTGEYRFAGVTTDTDICASIGVEILAKHRGSAVDAAIATLLCNGVVNFASSGIGGGCVMTIYDTPNEGPQKKVVNTIIARERAPLKAKEDMYVNDPSASKIGGKAIGVPGEIKGFHEAWLKFGRVPWKTLFESSIKIANTGFVVRKWLEFAAKFTDSEGLLRNNPELSKLLVKDDGSIVKRGDIIKRPKYAATLEKIADDPKAFYHMKSQLAKDIVADITDHDGIISQKDLHIYKVYDKNPISVHLNNGDKTVYGPRPPISGVVVAFILNILDEYGMTPDDFSSKNAKGLTLHRITEAYKFAFAKRSALGDEEFVDGLEELLNNMTSDDYARTIKELINDTHTQDVEFYGPSFTLPPDSGTSHVSVLAADGAAVAVTSTINLFFGSKVVGSRTGIVFNNEMDDFSTPGQVNFFGISASPSNFIKPKKMPMSSMSPIIVLDKNGDVSFVSGGSGGTRITTSTAMVTALSLWLGLNATEATDFPRIHHQLLPNEAVVSNRLAGSLKKELQKRGHKVVESSSTASIQSIHNRCSTSRPDYVSDYDVNCIDTVSDAFKGGNPDGY